MFISLFSQKNLSSLLPLRKFLACGGGYGREEFVVIYILSSISSSYSILMPYHQNLVLSVSRLRYILEL